MAIGIFDGESSGIFDPAIFDTALKVEAVVTFTVPVQLNLSELSAQINSTTANSLVNLTEVDVRV